MFNYVGQNSHPPSIAANMLTCKQSTKMIIGTTPLKGRYNAWQSQHWCEYKKRHYTWHHMTMSNQHGRSCCFNPFEGYSNNPIFACIRDITCKLHFYFSTQPDGIYWEWPSCRGTPLSSRLLSDLRRRSNGYNNIQLVAGPHGTIPIQLNFWTFQKKLWTFRPFKNKTVGKMAHGLSKSSLLFKYCSNI